VSHGVAIAVALTGALFVLLCPIVACVVFERREDRRRRRVEWPQSLREFDETVAFFAAERERNAAAFKAISDHVLPLSWRDARAFCEAETGRECTCATKFAMAARVHRVREQARRTRELA
jgi:hypothetical protein